MRGQREGGRGSEKEGEGGGRETEGGGERRASHPSCPIRQPCHALRHPKTARPALAPLTRMLPVYPAAPTPACTPMHSGTHTAPRALPAASILPPLNRGAVCVPASYRP